MGNAVLVGFVVWWARRLSCTLAMLFYWMRAKKHLRCNCFYLTVLGREGFRSQAYLLQVLAFLDSAGDLAAFGAASPSMQDVSEHDAPLSPAARGGLMVWAHYFGACLFCLGGMESLLSDQVWL